MLKHSLLSLRYGSLSCIALGNRGVNVILNGWAFIKVESNAAGYSIRMASTHMLLWEFPGLRPNLTPARKYWGGRNPSVHTSHLAFSVTLATHNSISSFHKSHTSDICF